MCFCMLSKKKKKRYLEEQEKCSRRGAIIIGMFFYKIYELEVSYMCIAQLMYHAQKS